METSPPRSPGVLLAILEWSDMFEERSYINPGTMSAGYQNFLICIEMFFAAIMLRYAFPHGTYSQECFTDPSGRSVTMTSISSSLKVRAGRGGGVVTCVREGGSGEVVGDRLLFSGAVKVCWGRLGIRSPFRFPFRQARETGAGAVGMF